jgi:hypothetical protein
MRGRGNEGFHGGRGGGRNGGHGGNKIPCQVCGKTGHSTLRCFKHFDASYNGDEKHVNDATIGYNVDTEWYTDTDTTDHITSKLDKLTMKQKYGGLDQVHATSGSGMPISHIGQCKIHTCDRDLILRDILHVSSYSKNLVSVDKFTYDNNAVFEFHPWKPLLHKRCRNDLYPLPSAAWSLKPPNKFVLAAIKPTMVRWHYPLGHASSPIVQLVVCQNNLSYLKKNLDESVCDAYQKAKSHQLPFPKSLSVSQVPLALVFSDVWGPAPSSVGRFKYYVSFINDYYKFTWVYPIKHKFDVFCKFHDFQQLVERWFDRKKSHPSSSAWVSHTTSHVHTHTHTNRMDLLSESTDT